MNQILFYLCCCLSLFVGTVQAQETTVEVYDGTTIKVGDIIEAGYKPSIYQYNTIMIILNTENLYRKTLIGGEFVGLEVYDFKHCNYNFIGSVK